MADGSISRIASRVSVGLFAGDLLAQADLISVESYPSSGYASLLLDDGAGVRVAITGEPSRLRAVLAAASSALGTVPGGEQP